MKSDVFLFRFSCASFAVSSFSILLYYLGDYEGNSVQKLFAFLTGFLFWAGLLVGIVLLILVNTHRKKNKSLNHTRNLKKGMGIISFMSNRPAAIVDIAMVALFIFILATMFIPLIGEEIRIILLTFLLCSVYMHSMLNGVNFLYINLINEECKK